MEGGGGILWGAQGLGSQLRLSKHHTSLKILFLPSSLMCSDMIQELLKHMRVGSMCGQGSVGSREVQYVAQGHHPVIPAEPAIEQRWVSEPRSGLPHLTMRSLCQRKPRPIPMHVRANAQQENTWKVRSDDGGNGGCV